MFNQNKHLSQTNPKFSTSSRLKYKLYHILHNPAGNGGTPTRRWPTGQSTGLFTDVRVYHPVVDARTNGDTYLSRCYTLHSSGIGKRFRSGGGRRAFPFRW
ncbi:hypothetical protein CEXT_433491 [Caerostris extrusa]|uniref:Uncharacterized protein n=1 Tax=Caerostris extrusa TaxID=172846 RepID=A0AAV4MD94_CAEEX|nr:hypothetical protein CEXT_433491 [Caerostris extrusa]